MNRTVKVILIVTSIPVGMLLLALAAFVAYPEVSSYVPRAVEVQSSSLTVTGSYYPLPLDQVSYLYTRDGDVIIGGYGLNIRSLIGKWNPDSREIVRSLPGRFHREMSANSPWDLSPTIELGQERTGYTFANRITGESFKAFLPYGRSHLICFAYSISDSTALIVFGAGDWKAGPPSYYGYLEIVEHTS